MIFQCSDLERALRSPELLPDAKAHAEQCEACARELHLWNEISRVAPQLHEEWESKGLWHRIEVEMAAEAPGRKRFPVWQWALAAAAAVVLAVVALQPWRTKVQGNEFLTDSALEEVQRAEAAYVQSIAKLSKAAGPSLEQSQSPVAGPYREKLLLLDSAIAELKANVAQNQHQIYLQNQLAMLYREKQKTLQEWTEYEKANH